MGITPQQFRNLEDRVRGTTRAPQPLDGGLLQKPAAPAGVILGIDPSLRGTGFGVINLARGTPELLAHGTIACPPRWERSRCLAQISQNIRQVITNHRPQICVIESLFYAQNFQTALIMGEARGASLSVLGEAGIEIYEIAPRKVKQAIVGYGAARKVAVARMVQRMLGTETPPSPDAADALALALAFAQERRGYSLKPAKRV